MSLLLTLCLLLGILVGSLLGNVLPMNFEVNTVFSAPSDSADAPPVSGYKIVFSQGNSRYDYSYLGGRPTGVDIFKGGDGYDLTTSPLYYLPFSVCLYTSSSPSVSSSSLSLSTLPRPVRAILSLTQKHSSVDWTYIGPGTFDNHLVSIYRSGVDFLYVSNYSLGFQFPVATLTPDGRLSEFINPQFRTAATTDFEVDLPCYPMRTINVHLTPPSQFTFPPAFSYTNNYFFPRKTITTAIDQPNNRFSSTATFLTPGTSLSSVLLSSMQYTILHPPFSISNPPCFIAPSFTFIPFFAGTPFIHQTNPESTPIGIYPTINNKLLFTLNQTLPLAVTYEATFTDFTPKVSPSAFTVPNLCFPLYDNPNNPSSSQYPTFPTAFTAYINNLFTAEKTILYYDSPTQQARLDTPTHTIVITNNTRFEFPNPTFLHRTSTIPCSISPSTISTLWQVPDFTYPLNLNVTIQGTTTALWTTTDQITRWYIQDNTIPVLKIRPEVPDDAIFPVLNPLLWPIAEHYTFFSDAPPPSGIFTVPPYCK